MTEDRVIPYLGNHTHHTSDTTITKTLYQWFKPIATLGGIRRRLKSHGPIRSQVQAAGTNGRTHELMLNSAS